MVLYSATSQRISGRVSSIASKNRNDVVVHPSPANEASVPVVATAVRTKRKRNSIASGAKRSVAGALSTAMGGPAVAGSQLGIGGLVTTTIPTPTTTTTAIPKGTDDCSYWVYRRRPGALTSFPTYTSLLHFDAMLQLKQEPPPQSSISIQCRRHAHFARQQTPPPPPPLLDLLPRCLVPRQQFLLSKNPYQSQDPARFQQQEQLASTTIHQP